MKIRFRRRPVQQADPAGDADRQALAYAKKGILLAIVAGVIFSGDGLLVKSSASHAPYNDPSLWLMVPLVCAGLHDFCAACLTTLATWRTGRMPELRRSFASKPGRFVIAGALLGSLLGMGGYMTALQLAGPAYVLPITTLYPAVAAILAVFTLKENITRRAWAGLALCVLGAGAIGYAPPEGQQGTLFYWGLAFAALAAVGWGAEGVCATSGMDFVEPPVALNMYFIVSAALYMGLLIPAASLTVYANAGGLAVPASLVCSKGALPVALAGCLGAVSYSCWYRSMNMTGVSRSMALNISYALWGIVLSALFTKVSITPGLIAGAVVIFAGMCLVIGNPRDMLNLRKVDQHRREKGADRGV